MRKISVFCLTLLMAATCASAGQIPVTEPGFKIVMGPSIPQQPWADLSKILGDTSWKVPSDLFSAFGPQVSQGILTSQAFKNTGWTVAPADQFFSSTPVDPTFGFGSASLL